MGSRVFTYEEALESFPRVREWTEAAVRQIESLLNQVQSAEEGEERRGQLDGAYEQIVRAWARRVTGLGCEVKGVWLVDWDCGHGYYCWRYPEESLGHFHGYEEGFEGRVPVN